MSTPRWSAVRSCKVKACQGVVLASSQTESVVMVYVCFLADFWLHVSRGGVCGGSKSLSKFT